MTAPPRAFVFSREYPPVTVGGTSTVARSVGVGLLGQGWDVTVVSTDPRADQPWQDRPEGVLVHRSPTGGVYQSDTGLADDSLRAHRRIFAAAAQLARDGGPPAVVVLPDLFCFPEAAAFARRHGVALVNILLQDFRGITPYDRDSHHVTTGVSADSAHLLAVEERSLRDSDHTVFISQALSDAILGHYPATTAAHSVIHLGVDPAEIASIEADETRSSLLSALPAAARDEPLVVACGRLVPVKGFTQLITALPGLRAAAPRPHLALIGVGPEEPHLRRLAGELGVAEHVTFLGDIPRRAALSWMSLATVNVVPSLWESFCYVCAEMMAFGNPVVATAVDSLNELLPGPAHGYPVPVTGPLGNRILEPHDLGRALRAALDDPAEGRRRGAAGRDRILDRFTNDRFARNLSDLCRHLSKAAAHV